MVKDRHVSIRLPATLVDDLEALAKKREDWDLSKEIRRALKLYVARRADADR